MQIITSLLLACSASLAVAGPALSSANPNTLAAVVEKRASFPIPASKGSVTYKKAQTVR